MPTDSPQPVVETSPHGGLTAVEVADRVAQGLVNRAPASGWADYRTIVARNVLTLFNALVAPAAFALFLLGDYRAAWSVSALAVFNSLIGLVQEARAKYHLDQLAILTRTKARVLRDGREQVIPADDVVLDDHVLLRAGEPVVADGTVLAGRFLEVDEALLTGESDPVPRHPGNRLLSGSYCVAGEGIYRADKVGGAAFAEQTSAQARRYRYTSSPLQRMLDSIVRWLTATAVVMCLLYVVLYFLRGFSRAELFSNCAATITSMVPQGLVLMATVAFTLGAVRMSRRGAVVQQLNAVESMASVDVLCMDKTGTLTTSQLRLDHLHFLTSNETQVRDWLRLFAWTTVDESSKSIQALRAGLGALSAGVTGKLVEQLPFKSQNRYSAVRIRSALGEQALALGAFEALRSLLTDDDARQTEARWRELLPTGLRLLLFAEILTAIPFDGSLEGCRLRSLALVALGDELRREAGGVLEALAAQGIQFKILSGDNAETVRATIAQLALPLARDPVVSGDQLSASPNPGEMIRDHSVFGRVGPQQKLQIVEVLQGEGHHVAMIGDGINDILPIKRADLGIAMGTGSSATKTVAGLVLETDDFALLPATLDEGRTILRNLRRASKLFLLKNVYTLFLVVIAYMLLGLQFPYNPQIVTLLNALTIGVPAFLIMLGRGSSVASARTGFLREVGWFAISTGVITGAAALGVYLIAAGLYDDHETQRTMLLSALVLLGLANVVRLSEGDRRLLAWTLAALPIYLAVMYLPAVGTLDNGAELSLRYYFELHPLSAAQWGLVALCAAPALGLCLALDWLGKAKARSHR